MIDQHVCATCEKLFSKDSSTGKLVQCEFSKQYADLADPMSWCTSYELRRCDQTCGSCVHSQPFMGRWWCTKHAEGGQMHDIADVDDQWCEGYEFLPQSLKPQMT